MADFGSAVITDAGASLLATVMAGSNQIEFTALTVGDGTYTAAEKTTASLQAMTALKNQRLSFAFSSITAQSNTAVRLKAVISNITLLSGFYVNEIGIWAKDASDALAEPILYSIVVADTADYLPAYNGSTPSTIEEDWYMTISNDAEASITVSSSAYVLVSDFDDYQASVTAKFNEIYNGTKGTSYLVRITAEDNVGDTVTLTNGTDTFTEEVSAEGIADFTVVKPATYTAIIDGEEIGSVVVGTYNIKANKVHTFAFHYSETDSSPASVTYPAGYDNSDWTDTAYMDFGNDKFHYGDWDPEGDHADEVRWLFPKSCMVKYDGTVDYYLNENDETKKADGTASDVASSAYAGNAMMEWGQDDSKIYWKIVPDSDGKGFTFVVANDNKDDEDLKPWNHYNCDGEVADHFYTAKYFGSSDGTHLRSISGGTNYVNNTAASEISLAQANNQTAKKLWNTEVYADWLLLQMLDTLISKSTNSQAKFGSGRCKSTNADAIGQGTLNGKGMFYGKTDETTGVKVWGMENPWGNLWRRIAGLINANGTVKLKLTYGTEDGSTASGYNLDGTGYITSGSISGTSGGYISHMNIGTKGITPNTISGSDTTYYCDGGWFNNSQVNYAIVGGAWNYASDDGAFCCTLYTLATKTDTYVGAALSCKPLA